MNQHKFPPCISIRSLIFLGLLTCGLVAAPANAQVAEARPVNSNAVTLGIEGYDPVAYFLVGKAVKGKEAHSHIWKGKRWLFSTRQHQMIFAKTPEQYSPSFDGCCPFALSEGMVAKGDPKVFRLRDGKLFFFYSEDKRKLFEDDIVRRSELSSANYINLFSTKF